MFFKCNNFFFPLDTPKPRSSSVYFQLHNIEAVFYFCRIIYLISCVSWVLFGLFQLLVGCWVCFESEEVLSASERVKVTFKCKKLICWIYNKNLMVIAKKKLHQKKSFYRAAWRIDDVFVKIVILSIHFSKLHSYLDSFFFCAKIDVCLICRNWKIL